jgi:hypothetical protein
MAITFPSSPTLNDVYTTGGRTWAWNGYAWKAQGASVSVAGATSPITYNTSTRIVGIDRTAENAINDLRYLQITDFEIIPLDDLHYSFDDMKNRFIPTYQGMAISITNPWKLQLIVNGVFQSVSFSEYVWQSDLPKPGFMIDNEGYIAFTEPVPAGATFDGRITPGPSTTTRSTAYPFKAVDILLGA